jgi:hypothetical protein
MKKMRQARRTDPGSSPAMPFRPPHFGKMKRGASEASEAQAPEVTAVRPLRGHLLSLAGKRGGGMAAVSGRPLDTPRASSGADASNSGNTTYYNI